MPADDALTDSHLRPHEYSSAQELEEPTGSQRCTPLPKLQLFILILIQFAEPVTALVIYPFIIQLIRDTGITGGDESKTGHFAGIIESIFFFTECLTVVQFGRASDKYGRRPVLLLGPLGLGLSMLGFGLSSRFWWLVVFRCLQGGFNGNIGVSKSAMAEISDSTNIAQVYSFVPLMWTVGATLGPYIGGTLANPASQYPDSLGRIKLLRDHPYFLPCAVAAAVAFCGFGIGFIGLKETLPSSLRRKRRNAEQGTEREALLVDGEENTEIPPLSALFVRPVLIALLNHGFLAFCGMSFDVLVPLVYATPVSLGGLGLTPPSIGRILALAGLFNASAQLLLAPRAIRRFGPHVVFIAMFSGLTVAFLAYPVLNYLARRAGGVDGWVIAVMGVQLSSGLLVSASWACTQIFIVNAAPTPTSLGGVNGLGQMVASTLRSLAPVLASSLFSFSAAHREDGWIVANLVFLVLAAAALCAVGAAGALPRRVKV
ncbi:major facilitator superfamily domain-containing protein [Mycena amicta]|nr:major facilitator superfamily domain-containing protein [Mycena amicta]